MLPLPRFVAMLLVASTALGVPAPNLARGGARQKTPPLSGAVPLADEADRLGGEIVLLQHRAGAVRTKPELPSVADVPASSVTPSAAAELLGLPAVVADDLQKVRSDEAAHSEVNHRDTDRKAFVGFAALPPFSPWPGAWPNALAVGPGWLALALTIAVLSLIIFAAVHRLVLSPRAQQRGGQNSRWRSASVLLHEMLPMVGIVITFCCYGIVQEHVMTMPYEAGPFPSVAFLVFTSRLASVLASLVAMLIRGEHIFPPAARWTAFPAFTAVLGSCCQHASLCFLAFPVQAMLKSAKIIPTVTVGAFFGKGRRGREKGHGGIDFGLAVIVLTCVAGFVLHAPGRKHDMVTGVSLLIAYLFCDALTSNSERNIYEAYEGLSGRQLMFGLGCFASVFSAVVVECTVGFHSMFEFLDRHPQAAAHVAVLSACSAVGQMFLLGAIRSQGPATVATATSVRQALSMAMSSLVFGHSIHQTQVACASLCFLAILIAPLVRNISMRATCDGVLTSQKNKNFVSYS